MRNPRPRSQGADNDWRLLMRPMRDGVPMTPRHARLIAAAVLVMVPLGAACDDEKAALPKAESVSAALKATTETPEEAKARKIAEQQQRLRDLDNSKRAVLAAATPEDRAAAIHTYELKWADV